MSAQSHEISPSSPEQESVDGLIEICHDQANQSRKFRMRENLESGTRIPIVDAHETTYIVAFQAQHCMEEDASTERHYTLSLSASYVLEDMIPEELSQLVQASDEPVIEPGDTDHIVTEYSLNIYLDDDETLQWNEGRSYTIWFADDEGRVYDPEDDGLPVNTRKSNYFLKLGQNFTDDDEEVIPAQETNLTFEQQQTKEAFELMMGKAGLGGFEKAGYIKKAYEILSAYQLGQEANFEIEKYFPDDVVQTINAQHTN